MKISKNELRKMIFETVLREQEGKKRKRGRKLRDKINTSLTGRDTSSPGDAKIDVAAAAAADDFRSANFETRAAPPAGGAKPSKAPNPKIKQVQNLLNSFLDENDNQLTVNGYWNPKVMDIAMEKVMSVFGVSNPKRSWTMMASELGFAPTLQGLIGYLIKKDNDRVNKIEDKEKQKSFDSSSLTPQKDDAKPEENGLKYPSSGGIKSSTPDEIKENTALLIGLFGGFPAAGAPKKDPNKSWDSYTDDEVVTMRNKIFQLKPSLRGKGKKELAIEFLKNNINYSEVKNRPGDDIKKSHWKSLLDKIESVDKPFDLDGVDYTYPDGLQASIKLALKNANLKDLDASNESKDTYGKSHGTLIRERYWGRY